MQGDRHLHKSDSNFNPPIPLTHILDSLNAFLNQQSFSQLGIIILLGKEKHFQSQYNFPEINYLHTAQPVPVSVLKWHC